MRIAPSASATAYAPVRATAPAATPPTADPPGAADRGTAAGASAGPARVAAVVRQLEAEAGTLDHAGRATDAAAGVLDEVSAVQQGGAAAAGHALTRDAQFEGRPLFDGRYRVQVGGGRLELPDFTSSAPTPEAVGRTRESLAGFRRDVIDRRLGIVRNAITHAADAAAVFLHDPLAHRGRLLDVTG